MNPTPISIRHLRPVLMIAVAFLLAGCVTHTLLIVAPADGPAHARYRLEGDSLDVFDRRLPHPGAPGWTLEDNEVGVDSSGNTVAKFIYSTSNLGERSLPVAPLGEHGKLTVERREGWFRSSVTVIARFPGWQALERYGDPDAYIPADLQTLEDTGMDSALSAEAEQELSRIKARARQLATVDRYLRQLERVVRSQLTAPDSTVVRDAAERFSPVLRAHLLSLRGDPIDPVDPRDVSLEWFPELREAMASAASEATGLPYDRLLAAADSLDEEYKRWVDLEDDDINIAVALPGWGSPSGVPEPANVHGDTLFWELNADDLAADEVLLSAIGHRWKPGSMYGIGAVVLFLFVIAGVVRRRAQQG